jgi:hypothetical protein
MEMLSGIDTTTIVAMVRQVERLITLRCVFGIAQIYIELLLGGLALFFDLPQASL